MNQLFVSPLGNREKLSDIVANQLAEQLVVQALQPGDPLPSEGQLAEQFGVSKTIVRESLRALATRGLIELQQGKVARIKALSSEPLEQFYSMVVRRTDDGLEEAIELRRILEMEIVALAAIRSTDEQILEMTHAIRAMEDSIGTIDPWLDADLRFHMAIAQGANNSLMTFQVKALSVLFRESMSVLHIKRGLDGVAASFERHREIYNAIRARDPQAAKRAMQTHYDYIERVLKHQEQR